VVLWSGDTTADGPAFGDTATEDYSEGAKKMSALWTGWTGNDTSFATPSGICQFFAVRRRKDILEGLGVPWMWVRQWTQGVERMGLWRMYQQVVPGPQDLVRRRAGDDDDEKTKRSKPQHHAEPASRYRTIRGRSNDEQHNLARWHKGLLLWITEQEWITSSDGDPDGIVRRKDGWDLSVAAGQG
jgi:hypothetical protein